MSHCMHKMAFKNGPGFAYCLHEKGHKGDHHFAYDKSKLEPAIDEIARLRAINAELLEVLKELVDARWMVDVSWGDYAKYVANQERPEYSPELISEEEFVMLCAKGTQLGQAFLASGQLD